MLHGVKYQAIAGLPREIAEESVKRYFAVRGLDIDQLSASIVTAPLKCSIDYVKNTTDVPGEIVEIDAIDPSFLRTLEEVVIAKGSDEVRRKKNVVKSIGGYVDAVVAYDVGSGLFKLSVDLQRKIRTLC